MRNLITYHPYSLAHCLIWHNEAGTIRYELILFVRDLIKILFALVIIADNNGNKICLLFSRTCATIEENILS